MKTGPQPLHDEYDCPICGGAAKLWADFQPGRLDGRWQWMICCHRCEPQPTLGELAKAVGAPDGWKLKDDPREYLGPPVNSAAGQKEPEPLPPPEELAHARARLLNGGAIRWLEQERGIPRSTAVLHRLAFGVRRGHTAFLIPIYQDGELVNCRCRAWPKPWIDKRGKEIKIVGLRGRPAALYPDLPDAETVVLCEGEFDALLARERGIDAVTTTCGRALPDALAARFAGRNVIIAYDAGSWRQAKSAAAKLREAGANPRVVDLPGPDGFDLTDLLLEGNARTFWEMARASRRRRTQKAGS